MNGSIRYPILDHVNLRTASPFGRPLGEANHAPHRSLPSAPSPSVPWRPWVVVSGIGCRCSVRWTPAGGAGILSGSNSVCARPSPAGARIGASSPWGVRNRAWSGKFRDAPAFQFVAGASAAGPWLEEVEPDSEEERQQGSYDVRPRPKPHGAAQASAADWRLELRRQDRIWWINHGPLGLPPDVMVVRTGVVARASECVPLAARWCETSFSRSPSRRQRRGRRQTRDPRARTSVQRDQRWRSAVQNSRSLDSATCDFTASARARLRYACSKDAFGVSLKTASVDSLSIICMVLCWSG
jgi:hypothetical protein